MDEKVIGILKNVSELIVATLVEETDQVVKVKNPAFLGISGQATQINVNFIPLEMLSLEPAVNVRNLLSNPTEELIYSFNKSSVLQYNLDLAQNVVNNYLAMNNKVPVPTKSVKADDNIVKLF